MREMKESGIKWVGKIPKDWEIKQIKFLCSVVRGGSPRPINDFISMDDSGSNWIRISDASEKYINRTKLKIVKAGESSSRKVNPGDLLLTNSMSYGKPYISNISGFIHDGWLSFSNYQGVEKNFLYYVLLSELCKKQFEIQIAGAVVSNLNIEKVKNSYIFIPSQNEQEKIYSFLDKTCDEIDSLTKDIQQQISQLEEYKKSVITEVVTKGLNPDVEMKDSGVEWIGNIPESWDIKPVKFVCSIVRGGSPRPINNFISMDDSGSNWIRISDASDKYINNTKLKIIQAGEASSRKVNPGDLLLTNSMSYGKPYITNISGYIHDGWLSFSNYKEIEKEFLYYVLLSDLCKKQFEVQIAGAVVSNLNIEKVKNSIIFLPSRDEQKRIFKFLDKKCIEIDLIINYKQQQLSKLEEYKKSLIYECVTGKKEVL